MKTALVIGYARSGKSVSYLLKQVGYQVTITEREIISEKASLLQQGFEVIDGGHPASLLTRHWDVVVKNPGIRYQEPFITQLSAQYPLLNEIEVALRYAPNFEVAAITGTNGKTTTTALLGAMLKAAFPYAYTAGNIGYPLSEVALHHRHEAAKVALEIAAFQLLGVFSFQPKVATILNLTPDHLDYFTDLKAYYASKLLVYKQQTASDYFLLNLDDPLVVKLVKYVPSQVLTYSLTQPADIYVKNQQVFYHDVCLFSFTDLRLPGQHNLTNALVAATMAYLLGVSVKLIRATLAKFAGVAHRLEYLTELNGVKYYNDSKATNVESQVVALNAFNQPVILLAGGYDKKTGFDLLKNYVSKIKIMIAYGETKEQFKALYPAAHLVNNLAEATALAQQLALAGDVVLFSPGCASFDQFQNFEERGDYFKTLVANLAQK